MRVESDSFGSAELENSVLYGIHSLRAARNFPLSVQDFPFRKPWYQAMGLVKQAYYSCTADLLKNCSTEGIDPTPWKIPLARTLQIMQQSAEEISQGFHFDSFIVPAVQGGAGTSINMNINEIIANLSLQKIGKNPGSYDEIHPIEACNIFQSTNDVVPSALRVALLKLFQTLEHKISSTRLILEQLENSHRAELRFSFTQMQTAVPSTWGRFFSNYSEALSRDWWRISKCQERLKTLNLGGGATGTGLTTPRYIIMRVTDTLRTLTNLPLSRAENLAEATANQDQIAEAHSLAKIHALNLEKLSNDLRLLGSDLAGNTLKIPAVQTGSSIMPGKINPVISEFLNAITTKVQTNDSLISHLCAGGVLDLNQNLPAIGHAALESLELLNAGHQTLSEQLLKGIHIEALDFATLIQTPVCATALIPAFGYEKASLIARRMQAESIDVFSAAKKEGLEPKNIKKELTPEKLVREGFSLRAV